MYNFSEDAICNMIKFEKKLFMYKSFVLFRPFVCCYMSTTYCFKIYSYPKLQESMTGSYVSQNKIINNNITQKTHSELTQHKTWKQII